MALALAALQLPGRQLAALNPFWPFLSVLPVSGSHVPKLARKGDREGMHGRRLISATKA